MFVDGRTLNSEELQADICIVGGGAAGIAIANALIGSGLNVVVLESGNFAPENATLALSGGRVSGLPYSLEASRLRFFGGSSNHWEGMCAPLGENDFSERAWIKHSGWPIKRADLDEYYVKAAKFLNLSGDGSHDFSASSDIIENPDTLSFACWRFAKNLSLGETYRDALGDAKNIRVIINSNLADIELNADLNGVTKVHAATLAGNNFSVAAKKYVLACGGIENARILLACNKQVEKGIGNANDLVGRFFMEHPHNNIGTFFNFVPPERMNIFRLHFKKNRGLKSVNDKIIIGGNSEVMNITISPHAMEKYKVGGGSLVISTIDDVKNLEAPVEHLRRVFAAQNAPQAIGLYARTEQTPNPESRVALSTDARDALGMPLLDLRWQMQRQDWQTINTLAKLFAEAASAAGLGVVKIPGWVSEFTGWPKNLGWGGHHMGTTRMGENAATSVVDSDCRMHGISNMYIAGSSVFPTSGWANPTYTIIALTLRLAEKLKIPDA